MTLNLLPTLPTLPNNPLSDPTASPVSFLGQDIPMPDLPQTLPGGIMSGSTAAGIAGAVDKAAAGSFLGLSISRWVAIVLGFIAIATGLILFRPVQEVVKRTAQAAAA